ncbi:MAG: glycoside hydrolase family 66 protein [Limnochordia bacterium]|nr:glycoside hydrolase family 66 protein [Limnochordia bacterium]
MNGVQFYDWLYRHDTPVPPGDWFVDSMGRHLRVETIRRKIGLAREFGMVPMAYVAVYAASPAFYAKHQQWGLYDRTGSPIDFGDGYLFLMDPSRGAGWDAHLLGEFRNTLECFHFAGIHIDQYGYPKVAYDAQGGAIVLASAFRTFINDTKSTLSEVDNTRDYVTFNSVANWPAAIVAESTYDFNYVEVWPPYSSYGDIERIIQSAYENSGGKATVIAAYVDAQEEATVRLLDAVIFAHGGTHIEMGEGDRMLVDPYFPKAQQVSASLWKSLVSYYDFIVRYKEWLYGDREPVAACECVLLDGEAAGPRPVPGRVHAICYRLRDQGQYVLSLINFTGANSEQWKAAQPKPEYIDRVEVTMTIDHKPEGIWVASPDKPSLRAVPIPFTVTSDSERITVQFSIDLSYWSVILFE